MKSHKTLTITIVLFLTLLVLVFLGIVEIGRRTLQKKEAYLKESAKNIPVTQKEKDSTGLLYYENSELGMVISYPPDLLIDEVKDEGGYKLFVRFEKMTESKNEGFAIGVKENTTVNKEADVYKNAFVSQANVEIDENTQLYGFDAKILVFNPKEDGVENRKMLIFERGDRVYSISSKPEVFDRIFSYIKFI